MLEKKEHEIRTYVALTSSFAGTGGIVEAMMSCVACAGHNVVASACAKGVSYVLYEAPRFGRGSCYGQQVRLRLCG